MPGLMRVPWPKEALGAPVNPARLELERGGLAAARLAFALSGLPPKSAVACLRAAAAGAATLYVAEYTLPERNLAMPAHWFWRVFGRRAHPAFWRAGALWGLCAEAALEPASENIILGGGGALAVFCAKRCPTA